MAININDFTAVPDSGSNLGGDPPQTIWMDRAWISVDGVEQPNLHVESFTCEEAMSKLYRLEVEVTFNQNPDYPVQPQLYQPDSYLGRRLALRITRLDMERYYCGIVTHFAGERPMGPARNQPYYRIRLTVMPRVWLSTQNVQSRVMPAGASPWDLIERVFSYTGYNDFDLNPVNSDTRFRVQYEESDFQFLSRTCEEMGIFYFFDQPGPDGERMIFGEAVTAYRTRDCGAYIDDFMNSPWEDRQELCPSLHSSRGYEFVAAAKGAAEVATTHSSQSRLPGHRRYDRIPYKASPFDTCDRQARLRMESSEWGTVLYTGEGSTFQLMPGFFLPCPVLGTEVVVVAVSHEYSDRFGYRNHFTCMPRDTVYRPPRITPRPTIAGTQTAMVTDAADPDGCGEVSIQFFWDQADGSNPCLARASHPWAGGQYGAYFPPQAGEEVVVSFLDGDPAQPLIIGRVYNGNGGVPFENTNHFGWLTQNGSKIVFDQSSQGDETITISQPCGNSIVIPENGTLQLEHFQGSVVHIGDGDGITVRSPWKIRMEAPQVNVSAAMVKVDAGMVKCSGVLQCDTLIANTVVAATYTPGAGNIW